MYFNSTGKAERTYDAIVIGTGISGGWAAKELCEKGYKTLVLDRGRMVKHPDYPTASLDPWDFPLRNAMPREEIANHYFKQNRLGWLIRDDNDHWFVKDDVHTYDEDRRFDWLRGYHVGGRSIMWGRHCYRWSDLDFAANAKEGIAIDWPIRYADIAPWYDYVEKFVGISGMKEGLPHLPDGQFLAPFGLNCVEQHMRERLKTRLGRTLTQGRLANLSEYDPEVHKGTRGQCQKRDRCVRGCPYGAYFSSVSATLPVAEATGNLTIRPDSIVHTITYDKDAGRATGVIVRDPETGEDTEFFAKIIFCNASTVGSTFILLNSRSEAFPNGMGNGSGELGHNIMDHHYGMGAAATMPGFEDKYYKGRRPGGFYIARFRNIDEASKREDYLRGFGYQGGATRADWNRGGEGVGESLKKELATPGPWQVSMTAFGEILPDHNNRMYLNFDKPDKFGLPTVVFDAALGENERAMREDAVNSAAEMLDAAGCTDIRTWNEETAPGHCIHEMGTARMGRDPKTSVLNAHNQLHEVPNVFVTDGACMTSSAIQNPSITYMALTARAVDYAHRELNKQNL